ncbi:MAG: hypothetical protein M3297_03560 [Thermoproteota archaeon]|nr:hypothetical protein [Thermoproteota archaeon]
MLALSTIEGIGRIALGFEVTLARRISMAGEANAEADGMKHKQNEKRSNDNRTSAKFFFNKGVIALDT